jgi:hypothetical protein
VRARQCTALPLRGAAALLLALCVASWRLYSDAVFLSSGRGYSVEPMAVACSAGGGHRPRRVTYLNEYNSMGKCAGCVTVLQEVHSLMTLERVVQAAEARQVRWERREEEMAAAARADGGAAEADPHCIHDTQGGSSPRPLRRARLRCGCVAAAAQYTLQGGLFVDRDINAVLNLLAAFREAAAGSPCQLALRWPLPCAVSAKQQQM